MAITKVYVYSKKDRTKVTEYSVDEGGETSWYPQRVSFNAFQKKYHFKDSNTVYIFDWFAKEERITKSVYCETVWLFYKRIGYDYKTKTFKGEE